MLEIRSYFTGMRLCLHAKTHNVIGTSKSGIYTSESPTVMNELQ